MREDCERRNWREWKYEGMKGKMSDKKWMKKERKSE